MQSGVIFCTTPSRPNQSSLTGNLCTILQRKSLAVLVLDEKLVVRDPQKVTEFIAKNNLRRLVMVSSAKPEVLQALQRCAENTGLPRGATSYIDLRFLSAESSESDAKEAARIILANVARIEHADHLERTVYRSVLGKTQFSRRELFKAIPQVLKIESDIPAILKDTCDQRWTSCDYCTKICSFKAISQNIGELTISDRLCTECGACARDCPIGAIQSPSISDAQIAATLASLNREFDAHGGTMLLTCHIGFQRLLNEYENRRYLGPDIVPISVPCVAFMGIDHYLWAASLGITLVTVCPDAMCKKAVATLPMSKHALSSRDILKTCGKSEISTIEHLGLNSDDSIVDSMLRIAVPRSLRDNSDMLTGDHRRSITLDAIRRLRGNNQGELILSTSAQLPFFDLSIDGEKCTFCELCGKKCPDKAIDFTKTGMVSLSFDSSLCGGCMRCARACPEQAISLSRLVNLTPILESRRIVKVCDEEAKCVNCGAIVGTKRSLAILKKKLSEKGMTDSTLRALDFCNKCKHKAAFYPRLGEYSVPPEAEFHAEVDFPHLRPRQRKES